MSLQIFQYVEAEAAERGRTVLAMPKNTYLPYCAYARAQARRSRRNASRSRVSLEIFLSATSDALSPISHVFEIAQRHAKAETALREGRESNGCTGVPPAGDSCSFELTSMRD